MSWHPDPACKAKHGIEERNEPSWSHTPLCREQTRKSKRKLQEIIKPENAADVQRRSRPHRP